MSEPKATWSCSCGGETILLLSDGAPVRIFCEICGRQPIDAIENNVVFNEAPEGI